MYGSECKRGVRAPITDVGWGELWADLPPGRVTAYFPFNGDLYAETDHCSQLTGLPAGRLTCSVYLQTMNLLMKMTFT